MKILINCCWLLCILDSVVVVIIVVLNVVIGFIYIFVRNIVGFVGIVVRNRKFVDVVVVIIVFIKFWLGNGFCCVFWCFNCFCYIYWICKCCCGDYWIFNCCYQFYIGFCYEYCWIFDFYWYEQEIECCGCEYCICKILVM